MGLILSLETTTTNCSVALGENGVLKAIKEDKSKHYSHAEKLHLFIQEILEEQKVKFSNLNAIAVSKGPGSYTGLRIGVSAAKGLCFAQDLPLIAVDTLKSVANQATNRDFTYVVPMLDARRMEVYTAIFNAKGDKISATEAKVLEDSSFQEILEEGKVLFIGDGSKKFQKICNHKNAYFTETFPSAKEMIPLAEYSFIHNSTVDIAYFEPFYLKDFLVKK